MVIVLNGLEGYRHIEWLSIQAVETYETEHYLTRIIASQGVYYSTYRISTFMNRICHLNGSTYEGRVIAARKLLSVLRQPPILIGYSTNTIIAIPFPKADKGSIYLFHRQFTATALEDGTTLIKTHQGSEFIITIGQRAFKRRMDQAEMFFQMMKP